MAAWTLPESIAQWIEFLTFALNRRSRKYLAAFFLGMILSSERRTVSRWLRAVGVGDDWRDHYDFLQTLGRAAGAVSRQLLLVAVRCIPRSHVGNYVRLAIDDSPPNATVRASKEPAFTTIRLPDRPGRRFSSATRG